MIKWKDLHGSPKKSQRETGTMQLPTLAAHSCTTGMLAAAVDFIPIYLLLLKNLLYL